MTASAQDCAGLANGVYQDLVWDPVHGQYKEETVNGHTYRILDHVDNKSTGYQGTIYQRVDTGEIVVAHRGTESPAKEPIDVVTDLGMVLRSINKQAPDAEKLTQEAIEIAKKQAEENNHKPIPEITVTGHSLGGSLAEWTASKYGLPGHTFNAYGVASLTGSTPLTENSPPIVNHVMAADVVSAASSHIGEVRVYATEKEEKTVKPLYPEDSASGVADAVAPTTWEKLIRPLRVAYDNALSSHVMTNFTGDSEHPSVLNDPQAQQRAAQNAPMFQHYRNDVLSYRADMTAVADKVGNTIRAVVSDKLVDGLEEKFEQGLATDIRDIAKIVEIGGEAMKKAEQAYDATRDAVVQGARVVEEKAEQAYDATRDAVVQGARVVEEKAEQAYSATRDTVVQGVRVAEKTAEQAYDTARNTMMQGAQAVEEKAEQVGRTVKESAASAWNTTTSYMGTWFGNDKLAQAESAKPSDVSGLPDGREPSAQDKVKVLTGDLAVDRMLASLNNPAAFQQSVNAVANSPQGEAIRAEGRALYDQQRSTAERQEQQEQDPEAQSLGSK